MNPYLQESLNNLSEAEVTEYRYGMLRAYREIVASLSQSILTENFIFKDNRITDFRTGELALSMPEELVDKAIKESEAAQGALYILLPTPDFPYIVSARHIRHYLNADLKDLGTLIFITRMSDIAGPAEMEDGSNLFIFDTSGNLIYGNKELKEEMEQYIGIDGYAIDDITRTRYFISSASTPAFQCISIFPYSELFSLTTIARAVLIISFILMYSLVFIAIRKITKSITEPIRSLSESMTLASEGGLDDALEVLGDDFSDDEIGHLGNEYRAMIIRLKKLITENYEKQILLKDTRYRMLRAQINPHFLHNTLNSIGWMIKLGKTEEAGKMLQALGNLLHRAFAKNILTTVEEEAKLLADYSYIQKIRYGDRFTIDINIPEELMSINIPPLMIQPLVENSLQYGPDVTGEPVEIRIKIYEEGTQLIIVAEDNGPGLSPARLEEVRSMVYKGNGSGIGLKNIKSRLALIYGEEADLTIESKKGDTSITIRIPEKIYDVQDSGSR